MAGELFGHKGPAQTYLPVLMIDVAPNGGQTTIPLTDGDTTIMFCFEGKLSVVGQTIGDGDLAVVEGDGDVMIQGEGRGLLLSSPPLNEPIARPGRLF